MLKVTVNTIKNDTVESTQELDCQLKAGIQRIKEMFVAITEDLTFVAVGKTAEDAVSGLQNGSIINENAAIAELRLKEDIPLTDLTASTELYPKVIEVDQGKAAIV